MVIEFVITYDSRIIGIDNDNKYIIKISPDENNGLSMENGAIKATKAPDGRGGIDGSMNTPGNGIFGTVNQGIITIRCNRSVTRLQMEDPGEVDGGISIVDIMDNIMTYEPPDDNDGEGD